MSLSNSKTYMVEFLATIIKHQAVGRENAINAPGLINLLKEVTGVKIHSREFISMINLIRSSWTIKNLVAETKGYYIATTVADRQKYLNRLKSKIESTQMIMDSFDDEDILDPGKPPEKKEKEIDW